MLWEWAEPWKSCWEWGSIHTCGCGCCHVSGSGCSHSPTQSPTAEQKVAQAEGPEVLLLHQGWVSMLLAGEDLLRASFKHGVTAEQLALEHK